MSARKQADGRTRKRRVRLSGTHGNVTTLPLLAWAVALVLGAFVLGMSAMSLRQPAPSAPPWSGNQAPPGATGMAPERSATAGSGARQARHAGSSATRSRPRR